MGSRSRLGMVRSSGSSARTGPASPPQSSTWPGCARRTLARSVSSGWTRSASRLRPEQRRRGSGWGLRPAGHARACRGPWRFAIRRERTGRRLYAGRRAAPGSSRRRVPRKEGGRVSATVRLLIADDHPIVRAGFEGILAEKPDLAVVGEAERGGEAVRLTDRLSPDVVLMDLRMPEMDGVEAIGRIKADHPHVQILVLTTYESDADILRYRSRCDRL